jgi:hypothetical protein
MVFEPGKVKKFSSAEDEEIENNDMIDGRVMGQQQL